MFTTSTARNRVDRQLAAAAGVQLALLAVLSVAVGLGPVGRLAGAAYGLGLCGLLAGAARRAGTTALGPADVVTLARASLVGGVTALVADRFDSGVTPVATLVVLASVALFLDAVDGKVARRTGTVSALGARFDMEVDAFLVLVLSIHVAVLVTPWALVIGAMRYAFVAASWTMPWLSGALPTRLSAKVVAALQGIVLVAASAGVLPHLPAVALVVAALAALLWSFGQSVLWLWRAREVRRAPVPLPTRQTADQRTAVQRTVAQRAVARRPPGHVPMSDSPTRHRPGAARAGDDRGRATSERTEEAVDAPASGSGDRRRGSGRRIAAALLTVLAGLLVFLTLTAPSEVDQLTPGALLRIPVEGLVGVVLLLVLPVRARRPVAAVGGVVLGALVILKAFDMGFLSVLGRPFDPVLDWVLLDNAREFLAGSFGPTGATVATIGALVLALTVIVLVALSAVRLSRLVDRHPRVAARTAAVLGVAWCACLALGAQVVAPLPVAARSAASLAYDKALQVPASLRDEREFAAQAAADAFRDTPSGDLLAALRGKDVMLTFVESYGRSAVEDPRYAPRIEAVLGAGTARLAAAGFGARSGWLTSPLAGGGSWMAHATLVSGLRIDNQQRYRSLVSSDRLTLSSAFQRANWETVDVMPGTNRAWPEGAFFGFDRVYDSRNLGYRGPNFGWSPMPDQYALAAFERLERARPGRGPLMAQVELTSSHVPWIPYPRPVDWDAVGDGAVFAPQIEGTEPADEVWKNDDRVREVYRDSTAYSLDTLISYVERYGDDDLVLVFLGDHQPAPIITGEGASHDVPITVVARDRALLDRISGWNWDEGLKPGPRAPVWPMEAFRDRFLTAFGPQQPLS